MPFCRGSFTGYSGRRLRVWQGGLSSSLSLLDSLELASELLEPELLLESEPEEEVLPANERAVRQDCQVTLFR